MSEHSLEYAQDKLDNWRREYNNKRTYSSLNDMTPTEFIRSLQKTKISDLELHWFLAKVNGRRLLFSLVLFSGGKSLPSGSEEINSFLGDHTELDADNMGIWIEKIWCSAIGFGYPDNGYQPFFPRTKALGSLGAMR